MRNEDNNCHDITMTSSSFKYYLKTENKLKRKRTILKKKYRKKCTLANNIQQSMNGYMYLFKNIACSIYIFCQK